MKLLTLFSLFVIFTFVLSGKVSCLQNRSSGEVGTSVLVSAKLVRRKKFNCDGKRILKVDCNEFTKCQGPKKKTKKLSVELHITDPRLFKEYQHVCVESSAIKRKVQHLLQVLKKIYPQKNIRKLSKEPTFIRFWSKVGEKCKMVDQGMTPKERIFEEFFEEYLPEEDHDDKIKRLLTNKRQTRKDKRRLVRLVRFLRLFFKEFKSYKDFRRDITKHFIVNLLAHLTAASGRCKAVDVRKL